MTIISAKSTNMAFLQKIMLLKTIRTSRGVSLSQGMVNTYKSQCVKVYLFGYTQIKYMFKEKEYKVEVWLLCFQIKQGSFFSKKFRHLRNLLLVEDSINLLNNNLNYKGHLTSTQNDFSQ